MKLGELVFADLWLLWLLLPLYVLWAVGRPLLRRRRRRRDGPGAALRFSSLRLFESLRPSGSLRLRRLAEALRLLTVALLLLAMARPQTGHELTQVSAEAVDIMLVLDTSGSMQALDMDTDRPIRQRRNRLEAAESVVDRFIAGREHDRLGLVVFGAQAFLQCPLTLDHEVLARLLEGVEIGMAGDDTALGAALGTAVKHLQRSPAKSKVTILLTDGRNNAGALTPSKAAQIARTLGIKVYTIGVGGRGQAPFLVDTVFGERVVHQDVEMDEGTLRQIAETSGGRYFRAEDTAALAAIYQEIDELEKTEITLRSYMEYNEELGWFVVPAMGLLLLEVVLLGTRLRKLP